MAAPYTNQAGTWVITTPLAPPSGLVNTYAGGWVSRGGVFAAAVSHVTAVTDNITGYDENDDPVFGDGVNIKSKASAGSPSTAPETRSPRYSD